MSVHSEIVRDYIELRNLLAQSHLQANTAFDVVFVIKGNLLLASSSVSLASIEVAKIQPRFATLYMPHSGLRFENLSISLIKYINYRAKLNTTKNPHEYILLLAKQFKENLDLRAGYQPKT